MNAKEKADYLNFQCIAVNDVEEDNFHDGHFCPKCKNKGYIAVNDGDYMYAVDCECAKPRKCLKKLKAQGLDKLLEKCTFKSYRRDLPFQKVVYDKAKQYVQEDNDKWFVIFGQSGCGKTHICTAIVSYLVKKQSKDIDYICWNEYIKQLNNVINTPEYGKLISIAKDSEVLYIDDFLKPLGQNNLPTAAELNKAFEILDHRVKNGLRTIISGERLLNELNIIDQAIASRIFEMAGEYTINVKPDINKNYRYKDMVEL